MSENETTNLLDCPFCGGRPIIKQTSKNGMQVRCTSCLMGIKQKTLRFNIAWLEKTLASSWNMRVVKK